MAISSFAPASAGLQQYETTITSSQVWTKPTGVKTVEVICVGGGGAGGTYSYGGSGAYSKRIVDVSAVASVAVTVGAGGVKNTSNGGDTSFGSHLIAEGGFFTAAAGPAQIMSGNGGTIAPYLGYDREVWSQAYYKGVQGNSHMSYVNGVLFSMGAPTSVNSNYMSTNNGTTWTAFSLATAISNLDLEVGWTGTQYYAYGQYRDAITSFQTSPDGTTWTARTLPVTFKGITWAFGKFYAVPYSQSSQLYYTSLDGITWTSQSLSSLGLSLGWTGIYGDENNRVIMTTENGYIVSSVNGTTFTSTSGFNNSVGNYSSSIMKWEKKGTDTYYMAWNAPAGDQSSRVVSILTFSGSSMVSKVDKSMAVPSSTLINYIAGGWAFCGQKRMNIETGYSPSTIATTAQTITLKPAYVPALDALFVNAMTNGNGYVIFKVVGQAVLGRLAAKGYTYTGGLAGIGAGGYGSFSTYTSSYVYYIYNPSPGIDGYAMGAGSGANSPGQGGSDSDGFNGIVVVRWWA